MSVIENLQSIQIESPVDKIIRQLRNLIVSGQLKPGDRLPAERVLAEKFGVGRSYVREAMLKLEFYGLLKTSPQSGTYVSGLSIKVLDNLISDIIKFNKDDFKSLVETRYHLELSAVQLAAERRTPQDVQIIKASLVEYEKKTNKGLSAVEEDMIFHINIAKATGNSVLESMILLIIPDLIKYIVDNNICGDNRSLKSIGEHKAIFEAIKKQDPTAAVKAMSEHLSDILQIAKN